MAFDLQLKNSFKLKISKMN